MICLCRFKLFFSPSKNYNLSPADVADELLKVIQVITGLAGTVGSSVLLLILLALIVAALAATMRKASSNTRLAVL